MSHQDFEKYANERSMQGNISPLYVEFFLKNISPASSFRILDFGCGDGKYFNFFKKFFKEANIYGTEISETRIKRCKKNGWENALYLKKGYPLPFSENYFDFINFDQVIEHIPKEEVAFYLAELYRVLKIDGKILILTPNYPIKRLYDVLNSAIKRDFTRLKDDPTHVNKYNFETLKNELKIYFKHIKLEATGGFLYSLFKKDFFSRKIIGVLSK